MILKHLSKTMLDRAFSTSIGQRVLRYSHHQSQTVHLLARFLSSPGWDIHQVDQAARRTIYDRLVAGHSNIPGYTRLWAHMLYVTDILEVPSAVQGDVIEFGCYKGASTAALSIACQLTGRRLVVADSFEGLPAPQETDEFHRRALRTNGGQVYRGGQFEGSLDDVKQNVARFGEPSVCTYVPGYYQDSLPKLAATDPDSKYSFCFLDVDLFQSTVECLLYVWPRLQPDAKLYTDDGDDMDISAIFFEREWWQTTFGENPPGLFGAGYGINFLQGMMSQVGLAIKGHELFSGKIDQFLVMPNRSASR